MLTNLEGGPVQTSDNPTAFLDNERPSSMIPGGSSPEWGEVGYAQTNVGVVLTCAATGCEPFEISIL